MKICFFLILTMSLLAAAAGPEIGDLAKLRGTWLTVSLISDGKTLVDEKTLPQKGPITKLRYEGNKWMVLVGDKTVASGIIKGGLDKNAEGNRRLGQVRHKKCADQARHL